MRKKPPFDKRRNWYTAHLLANKIVVLCPQCGRPMWWQGGATQMWRCSMTWSHHWTWYEMEDIVANTDNDID